MIISILKYDRNQYIETFLFGKVDCFLFFYPTWIFPIYHPSYQDVKTIFALLLILENQENKGRVLLRAKKLQ